VNRIKDLFLMLGLYLGLVYLSIAVMLTLAFFFGVIIANISTVSLVFFVLSLFVGGFCLTAGFSILLIDNVRERFSVSKKFSRKKN